MTRDKHDTIQPNGQCWDCGGQAIPVSNSTETQTTIGWQCGCGRFWPALGDDVLYWAAASSSVRGIGKSWYDDMEAVAFKQDVEGEIERGQTRKEAQ
jgi:hypothetical protein